MLNALQLAHSGIVRYLNGSIDLGLKFDGNQDLLAIGYADASWADCKETRHSQSGYVFLLTGCAISWASKKQPTVALSTCEAEYVAAALAAQEAIWIKRLLKEMNYKQDNITIYDDNLSTIDVSRNPKFHSRMKHMDIKYHFLRDNVESGDISLKYVGTDEQIADVLTKALAREKFQKFTNLMGCQRL